MVRAERSLLNIQSGAAVVLGDTGQTAAVVEVLDDLNVVVRCADESRGAASRHVTVPAHEFQRLPDGRLSLPEQVVQRRGMADSSRERPGKTVIPVAEEQLKVGRRTIETGRVVVDKKVRQVEQTIDEPVVTEQAEVRRVPINRVIDTPQEVREEGDELVIPLMEEVLVVEKKLMLREELRISRVRSESREQQTHTLRREEAQVKRTDPSTSTSSKQ